MNFRRALGVLPLSILLACSVEPCRAAEPEVIASGANSAGLEIRIDASPPIRNGSSIRITTTAKRRGYLVLLMIEPGGEVRQIFPLIQSDLLPFGATLETNAIRPGIPLTIPDPANVLGNAEQFATGPGKSAVVALHSPVPVQLVGLTELPDAASVSAAVKNVFELVKGLQIVPRSDRAKPVSLTWSSTALVYGVE